MPDDLPTFLVIGAMKSGTASLYRYLSAHPDVFTTTPKEPEFFSYSWDRGLDWYRSLFAGSEGFDARGECSTGYSKAPFRAGVPQRVRQVVPDAKLLYVIRDPVERIRSHYVHEISKRREDEAFDDAIRHRSNYLDFTRYAYQLDLYLAHFPREQLLVLRTEDLRDGRDATLAARVRIPRRRPGLGGA